MAAPYFSVVIDNFNYGRFLAQAIDSALAQDFPAGEVEIIVVDDGSTDDSREVAGRYKDKIRLIAQKNGGQAAAFKSGFAAARGQVIPLRRMRPLISWRSPGRTASSPPPTPR